MSFAGIAPTIGLVEGVLLLAENLPRVKNSSLDTNPAPDKPAGARLRSNDNTQVVDGAENRQAWMLIGSAIRMAYGLGIDQVIKS